MSILLTGGAGFIGSHTAVSLLEKGYDVVIADNFSNSKPDVTTRIGAISGENPDVINADLREMRQAEDIFDRHPDIDAVIHFAGLKAVGESVNDPLLYYHDNLTITLNLLNAMRQAGIGKLVFSSSATVYASDAKVPYTENSSTGASNPYGWTKYMIEQILRDVCMADRSFSVALLRYFNPIGAHDSGRIGEDPLGVPTNLIPYIAKVAIGELPHVNVFGGDYDTHDGTGLRDYIHIMDLAEGHVLALDYLSKHTGTSTFNLGTGKASSVLDVITAYEKACGRPIEYVIGSRRNGDLPTVYACPEYARLVLGFTARYDLKKMCEDSWRWQQFAFRCK